MDTIQVYFVRKTDEFRAWLGRLDPGLRLRILARLRRIEAGNLGDWRSVGGDVSEVRMDVGPGYRLYFTRRGRTVIVMLAGGDKSTQLRDIIKARQIARELQQ